MVGEEGEREEWWRGSERAILGEGRGEGGGGGGGGG